MMKQFPQTSYNLHALRVLEYDQVREIVATHADSDEGRSRLSGLFPYDDTAVIQGLLSEVKELMDAIRFDDPPPELSIHDIRKLFPLMKIEGYNLGIEGIASVADNLVVARNVKRYFEERVEKYPIVWGIAGSLTLHKDVEDHIRKVITPERTIDDNASSELRSIRHRLARARSSLRELVEKTLAGLPDEVVSERLITIRNNRFVIPVRDSMKKRVPGAIHDRSQTGKTMFIEPLLSIEANNRVRELEMAERAEIERILVELTAHIASAANEIERNQDVLVRLDVIKAKARFGVTINGAIPQINDEPVLCIKRGRHPLLHLKYRKLNDGSVVVPLDVDIGESYVTIVITGPNAGGKTVALKTVGLLTVMALAGLPVSADEGTAVFLPAGIFSDIGDEQSIENDLSTFSSHMSQIVTILEKAGPGTLVLLDELGGGTNPSDGEAIALAVLEKLTEMRALTIATTHHGGLKVFAHETEGVVNASLEFDNVNLRPTFVFRKGVPGSSYAFEIAGRLGMPADILQNAESRAGGERKSLDGLIAEMEEHVRKADEERIAALSERAALEEARKKYEQQLEDITQRKHEILSEALAESQKIVKDTNRRIESAIKTIREKEAAHKAIVEAKSEVSQLKKELKQAVSRLSEKEKKRKSKPVQELKKGLTVWVESLGSDAVVEEILDEGEKARIRVGRSKASVVVHADDLFEAAATPAKRAQVVNVNVKSPGITSYEIDLRGMTFDEAREALDIFLDRLHLAGVEIAHVIHGKGTGALRKKIGSYFDTHAYVESYRLGNWNEGSSGVTVVTLKK